MDKNAAKLKLESFNLPANSQNVARLTNLHSFASYDKYRDICITAVRYIRHEYNIRNIELLEGDHIKDYLDFRIDTGIKLTTFNQNCSALAKLGTALNSYATENNICRKFDFGEYISASKADAREILDRTQSSRAYPDPELLISYLSSIDHSLAASIQLEGGGRINEIYRIVPAMMKGFQQDEITGLRKGYIGVIGKGGKERPISVSVQTYERLQKCILERGEFSINKTLYSRDIKKTALLTRQGANGSHGLRWNFAQRRMEECQRNGLSYSESLLSVSKEMGHNRAEITTHYLI